MSRKIPEKLRLRVSARANFRCEYCGIPDLAGGFDFQIDHILAQQHGGKTIFSNLAYCCARCNGAKGPNLGSLLESKKRLTRFFNPRTDRWNAHFEIVEAVIVPKTNIGLATVSIFKFNIETRIVQRRALIEKGYY